MLSFLSPLFLAGAVTAAIPVILHLLKREPEARVKFAAVRLLKQGAVEQTRHRRLRDLLLLALRVAALLLLALAFARPFLATAAGQSSSITVIALDTSLSLSAPGRFDRAKELTRDAIRRVPSGDLVAVVTFADAARVASAVSGDRTLAMAAVDRAASDFGATRYRDALHAAADLLQGHRGTIVIVSDLQASGWDAGDRVAVPESARIEVVDVGALPPNLAVVAARATADRLVATIRNSGAQAREVHVVLTGTRGPVSEARMAIGANQSADVSMAKPEGETAAVSVIDNEGIDGDNTRYVVLANARRQSILVVSATGDLPREAFYLQQALSAGGRDGTAYDVEGVGAPQLASWDAARLETHAAVVLASTRGLDERGRDLIERYVKGGGGVLVAAASEVDSEIVADALGESKGIVIGIPGAEAARTEPRTLVPVDARHPVFRIFGTQAASLALVHFRRIAAIGGTGCETLAGFTSGEAALLDCARGEGRALILASDLDNQWNDFPRRATFLPFVHEMVRYLAGSRPRQSEYIVGEQPIGVSRQPGVARLAVSDGSARWVAVNVDPRESESERMTTDEFLAAVAHLKDVVPGGNPVARQQEDRQHLWQYALALVVALLVTESLVATRTA